MVPRCLLQIDVPHEPSNFRSNSNKDAFLSRKSQITWTILRGEYQLSPGKLPHANIILLWTM